MMTRSNYLCGVLFCLFVFFL